MNFNWDMFSEKDYNLMLEKCNDCSKAIDNVYFGSIMIGELCFNIVVNYDEESEKPFIRIDGDVANENTGYAYKRDENGNVIFSYDCIDCFSEIIENISYSDFKELFEYHLSEFIHEDFHGYNLVEKANTDFDWLK